MSEILARLLGSVSYEKLQKNIFPLDKDYSFMEFDFTHHNWITRFSEHLVYCYDFDFTRNFRTKQGKKVSEDEVMELIHDNVLEIEKELVGDLIGFCSEYNFDFNEDDFFDQLQEVDRIALKQGFSDLYSTNRDLDYLLRIFRSVKRTRRHDSK